MWNESSCRKPTKIAAEDVLLLSPSLDVRTRWSVSLSCSHSPGGELLNEHMHILASPTSCRYSKRKEEVGSGE